MIGCRLCSCRHQGTLADIAITAATQDTPQFGVQALRDALQIGQGLYHCIGRVGVVHHGQGQINAFNTRQRVTAASGDLPLGFQPAYRDPIGRTVMAELRKVF